MSVLDLIGLQRIYHNGIELFRRKNLNFVGGTVTDNPKTDSTDISISGGGGGGGDVASVFGRTGAVMAQTGDYNSGLVTNNSVVPGSTVTQALNSLNATDTSKVSGPASATDGAVALYSGTTGKLIKNSVVTISAGGDITTPGLIDGRDVSADGAKLDGIPPGGGGGGGAVSSVFTRTGAVVATLGDYTSALVTNVSAVAGATVSAALDALNTLIAGKVSGPGSSTDSALMLFSGTTGKLAKNSNVTVDGSGNITTPGLVDGRDISADGAKLDGIPAGGGAGAVASVFGRVGTVVAAAGDYTSSLVSNVSTVAGSTVTAALDALSANKADKLITVKTEPAAVHALVLADLGSETLHTATTGAQLTVPNDATLNLPVGFLSLHTYDVTGERSMAVVGLSGVSFTPASSFTVFAGDTIALRKLGANRWGVSGVYDYV